MSRSDLATLSASILLCLICALPASAQDLDADVEAEFPDEELPYVGLGPGLTSTFIFMDLDELNELAGKFDVDRFGGPLTVYGGGAIFTPIFIPNIRVSFHAFGGYHRSSRPIKLNDVEYNRTLRFGIRFQGMAGVDYAVRLSGKLTVLPGLTAGWGSYALEFTQSTANQATFASVWDSASFRPDTAATMSHHNRAVRMLNYHAFVLPMVHFEYAIMSSLLVRASVGYHYAILDDEWTNEAETVYTDVPDINANGPAVQVGVFIGLFQQ
jgi:hypothetical protein